MKLKILNPVPGIDFVEPQYRAYLDRLLPPGVELGFEGVKSGYPSIEAETHTVFNAPEIIRLAAKAQDEGYQGIFINCYADPGLAACREFLRIPILGGYVPSMLSALSMAERVGIITINRDTMSAEERKARLMGIESRIAAISMVDIGVLDLRENPEALLKSLADTCMQMWHVHRAGAAVLGCTGMQFIVDTLRERLKETGCPIQIVEPFAAGATMLEYMVRMGRTNSVYSLDSFVPPPAL